MKVVGVISVAALFLLLGAIVPAFGQDEHQPEAKPEAKPAQHEEETKPTKQQEQSKPEKQQETKPAKPENEAKSAKKEPAAKPAEQENEAKSAKKESDAKPEEHRNAAGEQHAQRTPAEEQRQHAVPALRLSARGSGRIPDDRYRANFGEEHTFVINDPVIVGGFSRFQYGGFWFAFNNPWPEGWYYTDDVYVSYIDGGYYLCNPYYPGARVGISVVI
jgi:flagellar motor protein MotB